MSYTLHFDRGRGHAHRELRVYRAVLANGKLDPFLCVSLESLGRDREIVIPYWQAVDAVNSTVPGGGLPVETSVGRDDLDLRVGNGRPTRLRHGSIKVGTAGLRLGADGPSRTQQ